MRRRYYLHFTCDTTALEKLNTLFKDAQLITWLSWVLKNYYMWIIHLKLSVILCYTSWRTFNTIHYSEVWDMLEVTWGINHINFKLQNVLLYICHIKTQKFYWEKTKASIDVKTNIIQVKSIIFDIILTG